MVKCKRTYHCLNSILLVILHVLAVICGIVEGTEPLSARCRYRVAGQWSALQVTVLDPLPSAWGYYVLVERLDDPNVFFERSRLVQKPEGTMVYEVYDIPRDHSHTYKVLVRPHGKNPNHWLRGYQQACELVIPPPPLPPPSPSPSSSPAEGSRTTEEEGLPVVTIAVMSGVVALCLFVCLTVTVAAFKRRKLDKQKPASSRLAKHSLHGYTHTEETYDNTGAHDTVGYNYPCPQCALVVPSPPPSNAACGHTPCMHTHHHQHHHHNHLHHHHQYCDSISITVSEASYGDGSGHVSQLLY